MPNNDSHQHVVKTSAQWNERAIEYWVVPRGCLCVELTARGKTKLKVGEGDKNYHQLPYICNHEDMYNYYTKEEVDALFNNLNRMAIMSTDEYDSRSDLPLIGNKIGDVRFVKSQSPSIKPDPDLYTWDGRKWIFIGSPMVDISKYVTREEFNVVKDKVDEIYPKAHTHPNKDILDGITQADRDKFDDLHNYDDTEIRELIHETGHIHPNKPILDTITNDSILSPTDREKFNSLHNYDDTEVKFRLVTVEEKAHTHANKTVLDGITQEKLDEIEELAATYVIVKNDITELKNKAHVHENMDILNGTNASYTLDQQEELYRLSRISTFIGAGPTWDGIFGYVPAPEMGQQTYFLRGDGTWAKVKSGGDKYKAGEGIYILSGEATSDTFPFNIYSQGSRVKQYVIYGNVGGVGELVNGEYHIPVVVSAPGHPNRTSVIILSEPMYDGDYIDFEKQIFAHYRTDITSQVQNVDTDTRQTGISSTGNLYWKSSYQGWGGSPRVTDYFELEPDASYEISKVYPDHDFSDSLNINLYDENKNRTRTIVTSTTSSTAFSPTENEKYMRQSYTGADNGYCHVFKLKPTETPCILQEVLLYTNAINTIDIDTTIKPTEVYFEVEVPDDPDPDDPMSQYTGIIYNDGILDVTQDDPTALNELTFHFRDNEYKVITIPGASEMTGATASTDGEAGLVPAPLAGDENKFLRGDGTWQDVEGSTTYYPGRGIEFGGETLIPTEFVESDFIRAVSVYHGTISKSAGLDSFTLTATDNDCYTDHYNGWDGYFISAEPNTKYRVSWSSVNGTRGNMFVFEVSGTEYTGVMYIVNNANTNVNIFTTSSTCNKLSLRFGVANTGTSETYSNITFDKVVPLNNVINAKLGNGLQFDSNNAIELSATAAGHGIQITSGTINDKLGVGLTFDDNDAITLDEATKFTLNCNNDPD